MGIAFLIYLGVTYVSADPIDLVTKATDHITKNQNSNTQEILNSINCQNNFIEKININQNKILTEHSAEIKGQVTQLIHSLNGQGDAINSLNVMNSIQKMADAASTTLG